MKVIVIAVTPVATTCCQLLIIKVFIIFFSLWHWINTDLCNLFIINKNFKPETYYEVEGEFKVVSGNYKGKLSKGKIKKFDDLNKVNELIHNIDKSKCDIVDKKVSISKEYAPKLFSLTSLQGYITSKYAHFTSDKVLSVCQSLYEGKGSGGYITYPRTDSIYLEESLVDKAKDTLNKLKVGLPFEDKIKFAKTKRVFDSSKVDSHSAIMPTYIMPKNLSSDELIVYGAML